MILVTVGAQMPFDRLVRTVDAWAARNDRHDLFAQVGVRGWRPRHLRSAALLEPAVFRARVGEADVVVAHAGMGTILTALELGTPILVMPRRADLRETRNDHQAATARAFEARGDVAVAWNEAELAGWLDRLNTLPAPTRIASHASFELLSVLRAFIQDGPVPTAPLLPARARPSFPLTNREKQAA